MQSDSYFSFKQFQADINRGRVVFEYELFHAGQVYNFNDVITFTPDATSERTLSDSGTLNNLLIQLHLALGISYWKTFCPKEIRTPFYQLSQYQAQFWNTVYTKGLGEFFYKNEIDYRGLIQFPFSQIMSAKPVSISGSNRSLVLLGGGKDSIVSGEILKRADKSFSLFAVNPGRIHISTSEVMGIGMIRLSRIIDPQLFELNKTPGTYNGHIPISSIFAFLGLFAAYAYDYTYVIASNEEGSSYGNVSYLGTEINHQWSKSLEFEKLFRDYCREFVVDGIEYFSLLRMKSELGIAKYFSGLPQYFAHFTSCNKVFRIVQEKPDGNWCGKCPKCAFVYLLLAAYLPKETMFGMFNKNLFIDESLYTVFEELCGLQGIKPFECVGTPEEAITAFQLVFQSHSYDEDFIIQKIRMKLDFRKIEMVKINTAKPEENLHCIPEEFQMVV